MDFLSTVANALQKEKHAKTLLAELDVFFATDLVSQEFLDFSYGGAINAEIREHLSSGALQNSKESTCLTSLD